MLKQKFILLFIFLIIFSFVKTVEAYYVSYNETIITSLNTNQSLTFTNITDFNAQVNNDTYLNFNQSNYVNASFSLALNLTNNFSISIWVNGNNVTGQNSRYILTKGTSNSFEWSLHTNQTNITNFIIFNTAGNNYRVVGSTTTLLLNKWYYLSAVTNDTNSVLYINGIQEGQSVGVSGTRETDGVSDVMVASREAPSTNPRWNGSIDEVRIYNVTLSPTEISMINNSGRFPNSSLPSTGLVLWYPFNENSGNITYDQSGLGLNGNIINGSSYTTDNIKINLVNNTNYILSLIQGFVNFITNGFHKINVFVNYNSTPIVINYTGSTNITPQIYSLNNALIQYTNESVACANINSCDGNLNITLTPLDNWTTTFDSIINSSGYTGSFTTNGDTDDSLYTNIINSNNATWQDEGFPSGSYDFNGFNQRIEINDSVRFTANVTGALTVCQWIKPHTFDFVGTGNDNSPANAVHFTSKYDNLNPGFREWYFRIYNNTADDGTLRPRRISFYVFNTTGGNGVGASFQDNDTTNGYTITQPNMWLHVCGVLNGTYIFIYRDGVQRNNALYSPEISPQWTNSSIRLGGLRNGGIFNGSIDEVMIFNTALTTAQIQSIYFHGLYRHSSNSINILDNFNLTEGVNRQFSPIWIASSSPILKTIASNITQNVNFTAILNPYPKLCSQINGITERSNSGNFTRTLVSGIDYTCMSDLINISLQNVEYSQGSHEIVINYLGDSVCDAWEDGFSIDCDVTSSPGGGNTGGPTNTSNINNTLQLQTQIHNNFQNTLDDLKKNPYFKYVAFAVVALIIVSVLNNKYKRKRN